MMRLGFRTIPAKIFACLLLVLSADWLFYGHPLGWTAGVFLAAVLAAACLAHRPLLRTPAGKMLAILVLGLAMALVEHTCMLALLMALLGIASFLTVQKRAGFPDGALWLLEDGSNGRLLRLTPKPR